VLKRGEERTGIGEFAQFRISPAEQLDAVGVVKRTGGDPDQFVPIVNVAAGLWARRAARSATDKFDALRSAGQGKFSRVFRRDLPVGDVLPFDASVLYLSRLRSVFEELGLGDADAEKSWGDQHLTPLIKAMGGEPPAYVACLVADGDHMGKAISGLKSDHATKEFSRALAEFARQARGIVQSERHYGSLVYSGGDDVLAFLPVETAPHCAAELATTFTNMLRPVAPDNTPTLSVGIGVGHVLESMGVLRALATGAERAAKDNGRNSLAIVVDKRSGGKVTWVEKWNADPLRQLQNDTQMLATGGKGGGPGISVGKIHEIGDLLQRFPSPQVFSSPRYEELRASAGAALLTYARGVLAQGNGDATLDQLGLRIKDPQDYEETSRELSRVIHRLLLVKALRQSGFEGEAPQ
jgi:CRISPR-associated protein Cmr2